MRKIVAGLFVSLDGVVDADAASPHAWATPEIMEVMAEGVAKADAVLLGAATYELLAPFWRNESNDVPMARFLNTNMKYVASQGPVALDWQPAVHLGGDLPAQLRELKAQPGANIHVPGSPLLVRALLREGLLDELYLNVCPVIVGVGTRLFGDLTAPIPLRLTSSQAYANGVVGLAYAIGT